MIKRFIGRLLQKAFGIRTGEISRALLMQFNIFLIITALLIVKPTVNGLFISRFGAEGLPKAYVLIAVLAIAVSSIYSRLMNRSSLLNMIIGTFLVNVIILAGFGLLLNQSSLPGWELYLIYIWVAVFGVFSASQFWILANILFNPREAKRLFGFIGAGAIVGGILGGYATKLLAPLIGSENLLFVSAGLLFLCIPITFYIWKKHLQDYRRRTEERKQVSQHLADPVSLIRKSRHLSYLAGIIAISVIVAKLVDFQYSDIAARQITDKDQLTAFFGFWLSNFSVLSLLFQLFLTRRLLGRLGIGGGMLFLPGGIFLGAVALLFFPGLWAAVLIKAADGSLKQSVSKASIELLGIPIPLEVKKRTKTFIDVVVDSLATGVGGLILIFLVHGLDLPTQAITLMIIALLLIWVYLAFRVRREYLHSFRVHILDLKPERHQEAVKGKALLSILENILENGSEREKVWALGRIRELGDDRFFQPTLALLDHAEADVRAGAIRALYTYSGQDLSERIWTLTADPDPAVRIAAFDYLSSFDSGNLPRIRDILLSDDTDYRVRGPVLLSIASETSNNPELRRMLGVEAFIRERMDMIRNVGDPQEKRYRKKIIAEGIGKANIEGTYPLLEELLHDADTEVVRQAVLAAGETGDPRCIPALLGFLVRKETRNEAIRALVHYGPGILDHLWPLLADPATDVEVLKMVTEVAERLETPEAVDFLFQLSDHEDQGVQIEALRSLTDLKRNYPHLEFNSKVVLKRVLDEAQLYQETLSTLYAQSSTDAGAASGTREEGVREGRRGLIRLLEHRLENHFERIFHLLGLRYSPRDFSLFFNLNGAVGKKREIQANTVEFLENLLHPSLKKVVIPIVESAMAETLTQELIDNLNIRIPTERECFEMLLDNNDVRIRLAVFYLIGQIGDPAYLPLLAPHLNSANPKVRDYAARIYGQLSNG